MTVKLGVSQKFLITCLHLDLRIESKRINEVENIAEILRNILQNKEHHIGLEILTP